MTAGATSGQAADRERGETLLELLIGLAIMSIAVVAVVGGLVTSVLVSDVHRKQSTAGAAVRDYAENVEKFVADTGYKSCAAPSDYTPAKVGFDTSGLSGYTVSAVTVRYWSGSAWSGSCGTDIGLQQLTVQVASADSRATEQLVLVLRKPCGAGSSC